MLAFYQLEGTGLNSVATRKIKVVSQQEREHLAINEEIRRHEIALIRALKSLRKRFPSAAVIVTEDIVRKILLTRENG